MKALIRTNAFFHGGTGSAPTIGFVVRKQSTLPTKDQINGGVVEGVWIFMRHGDRTPTRPLMEEERAEEEKTFWRTTLPTPEPLSAFKKLSENFPPNIHSSNSGQFMDVKRRPYGLLTRQGVSQMKQNGRRFFNRYEKLGFHIDSSLVTEGESVGDTFLQSWDLKVFSTNYLRTVLSAQAFLDGLLGSNSYDPNQYTSSLDEPLLVPDHSTRPEALQGKVEVLVRSLKRDTLNAFDRNPDEMKTLVLDVTQSEAFQSGDSAAIDLASKLMELLPGLEQKGKPEFRGPSEISWICASDHFVCRNAHNIKYSQFSRHHDDDAIEEKLRGMAPKTVEHLVWRFRQWYKSFPLVSAIAVPPLREILLQMHATPTMGVEERHPFVIYSCHDVTLLALLYGVGASFLSQDDTNDWQFWPAYGTTLVFELVRTSDFAGQDSHSIRILLNGKPVHLLSLPKGESLQEQTPLGNGPMKMLTLQEFEANIMRLEELGGFDMANFGYHNQ